ncbi:hypothetical protein [Sphingosinicella sp.]|uniref:hypothetical protein n=1 Tax=Sphingosinicella sp. TaxID=1917971 RepID=UPI004037BCA3
MPRAAPSVSTILQRAADAAFGKPLVTNIHRGLIAEAVVATALEPEWRWCSEDYASWDFERADGVRLEVKQSAARQTWEKDGDKPSACSFDIAERKGRYEGTRWIAAPGRNAHLYIFAHHPQADSHADHRDPLQWHFYVVRTDALPLAKRIGLASVSKLSKAVDYAGLPNAVAETAAHFD